MDSGYRKLKPLVNEVDYMKHKPLDQEVDDRKHIHLAYTDCPGLRRQLAYVYPRDKEKKHSNFSTICSASDLIKVLEEEFQLQITVESAPTNTFPCKICNKCIGHKTRVQEANIISPPPGEKGECPHICHDCITQQKDCSKGDVVECFHTCYRCSFYVKL